jgi:tetratricopeptide (TPR) repeat protein
VIQPAELAACCAAATERRVPTLVRARVARSSGQLRACRVALTAHLVMRRVATGSQTEADARLGRLRHELEIPGGPGEEARHLLQILDAMECDHSHGELCRALTDYAVYLREQGLSIEALLVVERLLGGLSRFRSAREAADLALLVAGLDVALARWQAAGRALDLAETAALAAGQRGRLRLVQLVRATVWVGQGQLAAARRPLESIAGRADDEAPADQLADAWSALGGALETRGLLLEALQAHFQALQHAADGAPRRRSLAELGELLRGLGAGSAARQAFTLALAGPIPFGEQVAARLELLDLAAVQGDRVAFERQRRELAALQERMPVAAAVEFLGRAAAGLAAFGQGRRSRELLETALQLAEHHELHEAWFRIERQRRSWSATAPEPAAELALGAAGLPLPWEYPEIAMVAEALDQQAETLVAQS